MEKIFDAILKLVPINLLFEYFGISPETSADLSLIITAVLFFLLGWLLKRLQVNITNSKGAKDLAPYFDAFKVKQSRELFIPTRGQNNSPSVEDEPQFSHRFVMKVKLIPWFLKIGFDRGKVTDKFYLILADTGMGKTTFMINLFVAYNSFFNFGRKYTMKLLPFGDNRIIDQLKEMAKNQKEAKNTILLLDAFDEYKGLLPPHVPDGLTDDGRFRRCLDEIVELTRDFREVVITCQVQYFPGQENQIYELKVPRFDEKGFHTLAKLYLSPFSDKDVKQYLCKKYGRFSFWNRKKKHLAETIVKSSPKLMVRPMLLAYIDLLVGSNQKFTTTYSIYKALIDKWIEREANKRKYDTATREKFRQDLHEFSMLVALKIYNQHKQTGNLSINKETAYDLRTQNHIDLRDYEITGQSLLNRDIHNNWKFSHKSILEFFLAKKCIGDFVFAMAFEFSRMDAAKKFYLEISSLSVFSFEFIKGGTFRLDDKYPVTVRDFYLSKYLVTQSEYIKNTGKANPSKFIDNGQNPAEQVSWFDVIAYCDILNFKAGFANVYDKDGNLLDKDGRITTDITKVIGFRLPTEAEWEYAAGGGSENRTIFAGSNNENELGDYAWYDKNSKEKTHPVGQKKPNQLGLYDMSGNVWEWCYDRCGYYNRQPQIHPIGPSEGPDRVVRGGSWRIGTAGSLVASRGSLTPGRRGYDFGFRLVFAL